jgi:hypothetical protein
MEVKGMITSSQSLEMEMEELVSASRNKIRETTGREND